MSNGFNRVTLLGRLGADPEFRQTAGGQSVMKLRLATNSAHYDKENKLVEKTEWHQVTVFGNRAEGLARVLVKGDLLFVEGMLHHSSYEKDGVMRYRTEVVARDIQLTGPRYKQAPASPPEVDAYPEDVALDASGTGEALSRDYKNGSAAAHVLATS